MKTQEDPKEKHKKNMNTKKTMKKSTNRNIKQNMKTLDKGHQHDPMETFQTDIMLALAEVDKTIISNTTTSIKNVYDQKEIELVNKYGPELVAAY